jgi:mannose/cellobiose epimerase-like protein (N-acyl-D-glucosamine 2-epimerase family)
MNKIRSSILVSARGIYTYACARARAHACTHAHARTHTHTYIHYRHVQTLHVYTLQTDRQSDRTDRQSDKTDKLTDKQPDNIIKPSFCIQGTQNT